MSITEQPPPEPTIAVPPAPVEDIDHEPLLEPSQIDPFGFRPSEDRRERPETD